MDSQAEWAGLSAKEALQREFEVKLERIRTFLSERNLGGLLLGRVDNFAWATCGADSYVPVNSEGGVASLLVTQDNQYLICNNIEKPRQLDEEVGELPLEVIDYYWFEPEPSQKLLDLSGGKLASDLALPYAESVGSEMWKLRAEFTPPERERFRELGERAASAMTETILEASQGDTEWDLAALLAGLLLSDGVLPVVLLVAADERIQRYRHPLPTHKEVDEYAMIVLCAKCKGLICSLTRFVTFKEPDAELVRKNEAVAKVDATFILNTRPGAKAADILQRAREVYAETGYADEWKLHHQGGACGYAGRDWKATPDCTFEVLPHQGYAWNPSIAGTKSEDTIITGAGPGDAPVIITATPDLPVIEVETPLGKLARPAFYLAEL